MKEKLDAANTELFNNNPIFEDRVVKLKFKEELVDYEPDTEDDVNSIESYSETADYSIIEKEILHKPAEENDPNLFAVPEADTEEDVDEEIVDELEYETKITPNTCFEAPPLEQEDLPFEYEESVSEIQDDEEEDDNFLNLKVDVETSTRDNNNKDLAAKSSNNNERKRGHNKYYHINCKSHCIERLDIDLGLSINRLQIAEKPCPMLKLQRRKCCEQNPIKAEQKLPSYGGHKSEYGLSLEQLEARARKKEMIKVREQKRLEVLEEYQRRKVQQNEQIFCQWLKNLARRKTGLLPERDETRTKKCLTPTVFSFPNKTDDKIKERPKTAHCLPARNAKKAKRPNTSNSCVFIEVPQNLLRKGISVGDIFVRSAQIKPKKLHFLSVS